VVEEEPNPYAALAAAAMASKNTVVVVSQLAM